MSNIKINDVYQRIQYVAVLNQTVFAIPFPFFQNNYVFVWLNGVKLNPGLSPGQYTIAGEGSPSGGTITLVTPSINGDIITIEGVMPIDRTSIYSATISNLTGSDLNGDFNREVVMMKQIQTTQSLLQLQYPPWAIISQDPTVTKDRYVPLLLPNQIWAMNDAGTAIIGYNVPAGGGIAPSDANYLLQTENTELPNAQVMGDLNSGIVVNTFTTGVQLTRILEAVENQLVVTNGSGIDGNPTYGFANNAIFPGNAGLGLIEGTTAQRPGTPTNTNFRFNTEINFLEYWDGSSWVQVSETDGVTSGEGTENQVLVNGSFGSPVEGALIFSLPQDIAQDSTVQFGSMSLLSPLTGVSGGTGVDNGTKTISLDSPTLGYLLTSDVSGNATWQAPGYLTDSVLLSPSGSQNITGFNLILDTGNYRATLGSYQSGTASGGFPGLFRAYSFTASAGTLNFSCADNAGAFNNTLTNASVSAPRTWTLPDDTGTIALTSQLATPSELTKVDDTNVTLTLGGAPGTCLLAATSLTLGWTGQLAPSRGGTGISALGTGVATALGANVNGSGAMSLTTSPTFVTPILGAATATSINFGVSSLNIYDEYVNSPPVVTFATMGDATISYSNQVGKYSRIGNIVTYEFTLSFTPTYTTASGNLQISIPFSNNGVPVFGNCFTQSPTFPAGRTSLGLEILAGGSVILLIASGSATTAAAFATTQIISTVTYTLSGSISYLA